MSVGVGTRWATHSNRVVLHMYILNYGVRGGVRGVCGVHLHYLPYPTYEVGPMYHPLCLTLSTTATATSKAPPPSPSLPFPPPHEYTTYTYSMTCSARTH